MSNLLAQLKASGTTRKPVELAGVSVALRILSDQDYLDADLAVLSFMKQKGVEFATESAEAFEHEKSTQLLFRALVDPETGERIGKNIADVRDALSRDQKAYLVSQYLEHERQCAPKEETMPEEEFAALLEDVKKKPATTLLNGLNTVTLKKLILSLASQPTS